MQPKASQNPNRLPRATVVFLSFFACMGLGVMLLGIREFFFRHTPNGWVPLVVGGVFMLFPLVFYFAVRKQREQVALAVQKQRSDLTPWLRREDWAKREISEPQAPPPFTFFVAAGVLVVIALWQFKSFFKADTRSIITWVFCGVPFSMAAFFCVMGYRAVARQKRFGKSVFKLSSATGVIGGKLEGGIHSEAHIELPDEFKVRLICYNQIGGGNDSKLKKLWEGSELVRVPSRTGNFAIPIAIAIPATCEETRDADASNLIFWRLEAKAAVPGVNYLARFDVPVFRVANTTA
ncbi:MAG: hypothetical protein RLZZ350_2498 [Verrucomicrobiota bacterium]|jgi:hypothetical protein